MRHKLILRQFVLSLLLMAIAIGANAQQAIRGTVYDDTDMPIPGASVVIDGSLVGASTNLDGEFVIPNVEAGQYTLRVSFVGFQTQMIPVTVEMGKDPEPINIKFEADAQNLDELIVVGYGVQRRRDVTGSIVKVESKTVTEMPAPSFEAALQGQAAGVQVTTGSGMAGSGSLVRIRGTASISANGDPLYVIDGIPITQDNFLHGNSGAQNSNPLAAINPQDIESIEILKDAAATGIYGSRGANGVILITTKRASQKGTQYSFSSRWGTSQPTARPNMLTGPEYLQLYQEAWENDGGVGRAPLLNNIPWELAERTNTNWVDETVGTGFKQMYTFGASVKKDKYGLYGNLSYDENQSYLIGNSYTRTSGRLNFDYAISKKIKLMFSTSVSSGINNKVDAAWSGGLGAAMSTALPIYPVYHDEDVYDDNGEIVHNQGDYYIPATNPDGTGGAPWLNPVYMRDNKRWRTRDLRSINNLKLLFNPIDNLNIIGTFSYDYLNSREQLYESGDLIDKYGSIFEKGIAREYPVTVDNWNANLVADYTYHLNEFNRLKFLAGTEYQQSNTEGIYSIEYQNIGGPTWEDHSADNVVESDGYINYWKFQSVFAQAHWTYKDKWIVQATGRYDGSSKFGPNNRFGFFPSASLNYIMSEEKFIQESKAISYLKLKSSYGRTGNAGIPDNTWRSQWMPRDISRTYNGQPYIFQTQLPNPNLKWETVNSFDAGFEVGLWKDRVVVEYSYYNKMAQDALLNVSLPKSTGYDTYWDNVAQIVNRGHEFRIRTKNLVKKFRWDTDLNLARNYNEIVDIGPYSEDAVSGGTNDTRVVVGEPIGTNFLVKFSHVDAETGRPVYIDINGQETMDWSPADRVAVGNVMPDLVGGITNTFKYGNWDMALVMVFSVGADIYDSSSKRQLGVVTDWNMRDEIFDRWVKPGDEDVSFPRLTRETETYGSGTPWINTDMWLQDGDYLRFRRLALAYNFNKFDIGKTAIRSLRLEASMTNFLTITNFQGLDPEIARDFEDNADRNMSQNITYLTPPQERTYNLALSFNF